MPRQATYLPSPGCIVRVGGGTDDSVSATSVDGEEGSEDESMSAGSEGSGDCVTASTDSASSSDEYEQLLSQFLGDDEPRRRKRHRG